MKTMRDHACADARTSGGCMSHLSEATGAVGQIKGGPPAAAILSPCNTPPSTPTRRARSPSGWRPSASPRRRTAAALARHARHAGRRLHRPRRAVLHDRGQRPGARLRRRSGCSAAWCSRSACCSSWSRAPSSSPATTCSPWRGRDGSVTTARRAAQLGRRLRGELRRRRRARAAGVAVRARRDERRRGRPRLPRDRRGEGGAAVLDRVLPRRAVQRAGLHGGVDGARRAQRHGQGARDRCFRSRAFVAAGFEHSIANMYLFPLAMLLQAAAGEPVELCLAVRPTWCR